MFFLKIVVSALVGSVLFLCQVFSCLMSGSKFWYISNSYGVTFSVIGRRMISTSTFDRGIVSKLSCRLKILLILYFDSFGNGPDKFNVSVMFSFSNKGHGSFFHVVIVYFAFVEYCFSSNVYMESA